MTKMVQFTPIIVPTINRIYLDCSSGISKRDSSIEEQENNVLNFFYTQRI